LFAAGARGRAPEGGACDNARVSETKASTAIVTGAGGFIASHTCEALLTRGWRVVGVDNLDTFYDPSLKRRNLDELARGPRGAGFEFVEADIRDAGAMTRLFERTRPGAIVHLAARAGVRPSIEQPALYASVNLEGTVNIFEAARRFGGPPVLMASSSSVYGNNRKAPFSESDPVDEPISPYAATKRACELMAFTYHALYRLPVACLRFFTVFGPRQRPDLAISSFMRKIARGEEITMFGDGTSSRDYTYIDDIVAGQLGALEAIAHHGVRIWNLGGSSPVTLREMIESVARTVGTPARVRSLPMQPGDVERTFADLTRSKAELGYAPTTPFEEGLRRQWEWLRRTEGDLR
jgi:UDP-glucuronate 4-epimerase